MTGSSAGKTVEDRSAYWRERIAEQERSGISVQQFCKEKLANGRYEPTATTWVKIKNQAYSQASAARVLRQRAPVADLYVSPLATASKRQPL